MYYQTAYFDSRIAVIHGMEFYGGQLFFSFFLCIYLTYISPFIRRRKIGNVHPVPLRPSPSNHYCNGQSETSYFNIHLPLPFPFFFSHLPRIRVLLPLAFTCPRKPIFPPIHPSPFCAATTPKNALPRSRLSLFLVITSPSIASSSDPREAQISQSECGMSRTVTEPLAAVLH